MATMQQGIFITFCAFCICLICIGLYLDGFVEFNPQLPIHISLHNTFVQRLIHSDIYGDATMADNGRRVPKIVLWGPWLRLFHRPLTNCSVYCEISNKTEDQPYADLLLFHFRDFRSNITASLPLTHPPNQNWVFVSNESPKRIFLHPNIRYRIHSNRDKFNSVMMYTRESDIFRPYGSYSRVNKTTENIPFLSSTKTRLILWYVSDCDSRTRLLIGGFLGRKLKDVDIFGECFSLKDPCEHDLDCVKSFSAKYKFYLAFENANCHDYITEKFWKALMFGMVPIVFGADIEDYQALAPPNSFIHVNNFTSYEALVKYIQYLDNTPEAYDAYHAWRADYVIDDVRGWWWKGRDIDYYTGEKGMWCTVCKAAHNNSFVPKKLNLIEYFRTHGACSSSVKDDYLKMSSGMSKA